MDREVDCMAMLAKVIQLFLCKCPLTSVDLAFSSQPVSKRFPLTVDAYVLDYPATSVDAKKFVD